MRGTLVRVLFANNYPTDILCREAVEGRFPAHHVWGVTDLLRNGFEVECLPCLRWERLERFGRRLRLGRWTDQSLRAFLTQRRYDVYYTANADTALWLGLLRSLGLFRRPIVGLFHHPLSRTRTMRRALSGFDRVVCLSDALEQQFARTFTFRPSQLLTLPWGIDLAFFDARRASCPDIGVYFVSAGKSGRDFDTLVQAFQGIPARLRIFCSGNAAPRAAPENVTVSFAHAEQCDGNLSFAQLTREYESAFAVCVPLTVPRDRFMPMIGLTSLLDAMAFGKPTIITRNPLLQIDAERERIGLCVETGDVEGWRRAIAFLRRNPDEAAAMGWRARRLCEDRFALPQFSKSLAAILRAAVGADRAPLPSSPGARRLAATEPRQTV